ELVRRIERLVGSYADAELAEHVGIHLHETAVEVARHLRPHLATGSGQLHFAVLVHDAAGQGEGELPAVYGCGDGAGIRLRVLRVVLSRRGLFGGRLSRGAGYFRTARACAENKQRRVAAADQHGDESATWPVKTSHR